jgi:hypothetical protein
MQTQHYPSITFTTEEQKVINEYATLTFYLDDYINQYGSKPDGTNAFKMDLADIQQYPRFTELVRSLPHFVEDHPRVKNALVSHSGLPWATIKVFLKFGYGPQLKIFDLADSRLYGQTVHPGFPESRVTIQRRFVQGLENANLEGTKEATSFLLTITLLHELVHYGAVNAGLKETSVDEFGADFEREVLGTTVSRDNAGKVLIEFKKNN